MDDVERLFSEATRLFAAQAPEEAERLLRQAIAWAPHHVPSLSLLGLIAGRAGRDAQCVMFLDQAVALSSGPQAAAGGLLLGAAHRRAGRLDEAETAYRRAAEADPKSPEAFLQLGLMLQTQGRQREAVIPLRVATGIDPGIAVAHGALASALYAVGDFAHAADHAERAVGLAPKDGGYVTNLAVIRNAHGRFAEAADICRRALMAGEEPTLLNTLGVALKELGDLQGAGASLERALILNPGLVEALYNLAAVRKDEGRTDAAVELLSRLVTLKPDLAPARFALCMAHLAPLFGDPEEIDRRRADYAAELAKLEGYAREVGPALLAPGVGAAQPFYLAYQGRNDRDLQRRYGELVCRAMDKVFSPAPLADPPKAGERVRLGIVSGHLRDHSVWRMPTRGWVEGLDRTVFELTAFHTSAISDAETESIRLLFDRFVQGPLSLEDWRREIIALRPHALIYPEVGMDPMVAQLAGLRLAPAQYGSWGHPSTTGYPTIDFYLSSDAMEPEGAEAHYSETLVRLPGLSTKVSLAAAPQAAPRLALGLSETAVVFWCGQSLHKYLPQDDHVFADIAAQVPQSRFVFIEFPASPLLTQRFKDRLAGAFAKCSIDAAQACVVLTRMDASAYRAAMSCADIMLDSLGWSGCNSAADALACGLPIITLPGETMRSRHAAAMLAAIGLDQFVCETKAAYVEAAVRLGTDSQARAQARRTLQQGLPQLNRVSAIGALERHVVETCGQ